MLALAREVVESASLEVFKGHEDVVQVLWFSGLGVTVALLGGGLDWVILKVSSNLIDSIMP